MKPGNPLHAGIRVGEGCTTSSFVQCISDIANFLNSSNFTSLRNGHIIRSAFVKVRSSVYLTYLYRYAGKYVG